jgi:hypothetical protein
MRFAIVLRALPVPGRATGAVEGSVFGPAA